MSLDLFAAPEQGNILPYDGEVIDFGQYLQPQEADQYLQYFLAHLAWQHDEAHLFGKHHVTERQVAWYGDPNFNYIYSGVSRRAHVWDHALWHLKQQLEQFLQLKFNSCLANLYHHGQQGMGWHQDNDMSLRRNTCIASLSLGATRKFMLRHLHTGEKRELMLQHGHLLVMQGETQQFWQHCLAKTTRVQHPRINLTFRQFGASL